MAVRITVDVDDELHMKLRGKANQRKLTLKEWCAQAVTESLDPPLKFCLPKLNEHTLHEFLADAKEIILVGPLLDSLTDVVDGQERYNAFFEKKLKEGVPLTAIMVRPDLSPQHEVIRILEERHGHKFPGEPGERVLGQLKKTASYLKRLREWGKAKVLYTEKLPMFGLAVANPYSPNAKMTIALYLHNAMGARDPFFVVQKTGKTEEIFDAIMRHLVSFSQDAICAH